MEIRQKILDIGIGKGGLYAQKAKNSVRFALDYDPYHATLSQIEQNCGAMPIEGDGSCLRVPLPFKSSSFNKIDIIFPLDELLYGLCYQNLIWEEFKRVLTNKGSFRIVTDSPWSGVQGVEVAGEPELIDNPQLHIESLARSNGFDTKCKQFSSQETEALGTEFSKMISSWQLEYPPTKVWEITGAK